MEAFIRIAPTLTSISDSIALSASRCGIQCFEYMMQPTPVVNGTVALIGHKGKSTSENVASQLPDHFGRRCRPYMYDERPPLRTAAERKKDAELKASEINSCW